MCLTSGVGFGAVAGRRVCWFRRVVEKLRRSCVRKELLRDANLQLKQMYEGHAAMNGVVKKGSVGVAEADRLLRSGSFHGCQQNAPLFYF